MALLNIRKVGDPVLRSKTRKVKKINDKTKQLLDNMAETMYQADGVGLAAPQVGILQRLFVVDVGGGIIEFINPEIISQEGKALMEEGCLSVPEKTGGVIRPSKVVMSAINREGEKFKIEAEGLLARALQHEFDHLDGILFIDKTIDEDKLNEFKDDNLK